MPPALLVSRLTEPAQPALGGPVEWTWCVKVAAETLSPPLGPGRSPPAFQRWQVRIDLEPFLLYEKGKKKKKALLWVTNELGSLRQLKAQS